MHVKIQFILETNPYLKKYLRQHSNYYKDIIRNPSFIYQLEELMKKEYHLTLPDKLEKIKDNISFFNSFMDVLK